MPDVQAERQFDGYLRVSRRMGRAGPGYISPGVQRDAIQRWADYSGVTILEWHFDEDQSGGTQARPGLRRAIERLEAGEIKGIACWKLNRFGRNVAGALEDIKRIQAARGDVVFVEEQIDTSGPFGQFLLTVLLAIAAWERDTLKANFDIAKQRAISRGAFVSRTPWGYARNEDSTLSPHPERAPIVAEAFRLAAGDSLRAAADYLIRVAPERKWTATKVRRLLSQRSYLGEARNGDLVQLAAHDPLVSRAVWEAAQTTPVSRGPRTSFMLSGMLRCGTCGGPMVGSRGGKGQRTYRCSTAACQRGAVITAELVEDYVREQARPLLKGLRGMIGDPDADALTLLERTITDAESELDAFAADMTARRTLGDRYHAHLEARADAVEKARAAYRERAREAQTALRLDAPDIVEDPQLLRVALRSMLASIIVVPGRGLAAGDRVRFVPLDGDGPAGEADAQRPE